MLIESGVALVRSVAQGLAGRGIPTEDLVAEGFVGLVRAADAFDPERGVRFSTFAFRYARHAMTRLFSAQSPRGRMKNDSRRLVKEWEAAVDTLTAELGIVPDDGEVAEHLGWLEERVAKARRLHASLAVWSRRKPLDSSDAIDHDTPDANELPDDSEQGKTRNAIQLLLSNLPARERQAIALMYGIESPEPLGAEAAAAIMGCTSGEVKRLQTSAHGRLRRIKRRMVLTNI